MIVTEEFLESIKNSNGVFSKYQNRLAKQLVGCHTKDLVGVDVNEKYLRLFGDLIKADGSKFSAALKVIQKEKNAAKKTESKLNYKKFVAKHQADAVTRGGAIVVTRELYREHRSSKSKMQEVLARPYGGVKKLTGQTVCVKFWDRWKAAGFTTAEINKGKIALNPVSKPSGEWDWKPKKEDIPKLKTVSAKGNKNSGRKRQKRARVSKLDNDDFYMSREWRSIRVRVLERYECKCMMCGRSPREHSIVIHVDHIKPRSKYPELSLDFDNLQLLCEDCNLGKSNKYETDWRPELK